jgi:cell division protein FtsL
MAALRSALPLPRAFGQLRAGKLLVVAAVAVVVFVAAAQVDQVRRLVDTGYQIDRLEAQRAEQLAANHQLEAEVAELSALARVDIEARVRLGMEPAKTRLYLPVNHPLPARQTLPTRYLPPETPAPTDEGRTSVWERLGRLLPF